MGVQKTPRCDSAAPARWSVDTLAEADYEVTVVWDRTYDKNPLGWKSGVMDISTNKKRNNATVADDIAIPKMYELVSHGRGPAVILTGSRGGMFTLPRLWELGWRGAA